jgi:diacylglycerol kinase family enzyme
MASSPSAPLSPSDQLAPEANRVLLAVNPLAGRRSVAASIERLADALGSRGFAVEISSDVGRVACRANDEHARGRLRALVGVGGDGTAAEILNRTEPGVPIVLLAAGTANLLARHVGWTRRPETLAETIARGALSRIDVGRAGDRLFMLMASCGFDAEVVRRLHKLRAARPGGHIGYWSYLKPILASVRSYEYPELRIECEGEKGVNSAIRARWAFVFNLPIYGWGVRMAPAADPADGSFDVCTFTGRSMWSGLKYALAAQLGFHQRLADCQTGRACRVRITCDRPVAYQLDGDPGGMLPVEIEMVPARMTLLVPGAVK